ncbi:hypothetical protein F5148DRAFT_257601 [Russula earlei]|uniref:Uncharacterized protein n=1 Tax=Russula earlei TaxID=71964 RepID=A0ACC0U3H2_9AGAM|nr:hypothetical protein F5148DRAFT_257601 [Russula earlei]
MSTLKLDLFPGLNGVSKTVSGSENLSSGILNQEVGKTQQTTGLLSGLGKAASKGSSTVSDRALKLLFSILSLYFSILRKIIPPSVWNFFIFFIPPLIGFYELAFRVYFPIFPPVFAIAFKLHQRGFLTIGTVIWLASSLPADFLGGLGALGGIATGTTVAIADGAAAAGHVLAGAVHLVGDAANTVTHGVDILKPGVVSTNLAHLLSGEHTIPSGSLIPLATTENAAKLADVLESVTPLQMNSIPKGFQDAQVQSTPCYTL